MKKTFFIILIALSTSVFAQNREQARQITDQLNTFATSSLSTTPNKALLYRSNRDNPDDTTVATNLSMNKTTNTLTITRGETLALASCSADYGTVAVSGTTLTVTTTRAPIRVLCRTADGVQRAFYTTYQE